MNHKKMKIEDENLATIKKIPSRRAYSTPRVVCYGNLDELTRNGGNDPPLGDIFGTGYTQTD